MVNPNGTPGCSRSSVNAVDGVATNDLRREQNLDNPLVSPETWRQVDEKQRAAHDRIPGLEGVAGAGKTLPGWLAGQRIGQGSFDAIASPITQMFNFTRYAPATSSC
jgi:hypothetical protein